MLFWFIFFFKARAGPCKSWSLPNTIHPAVRPKSLRGEMMLTRLAKNATAVVNDVVNIAREAFEIVLRSWARVGS